MIMGNSQENEIWRVLPQFKTPEGKNSYEVSDKGRVRRRLFYGSDYKGLSGKGKTMPITARDIRGEKCVRIRQNQSSSYHAITELLYSVFTPSELLN